jgi:hypothetical protein
VADDGLLESAYMKIRTPNSSGKKARSASLSLALLIVGAGLFGPGWSVQRCVAGTGFPTTPTDGSTFSIGVVQIVVDPSFAFLFAPSNSFSYYPGYAGPGSGILTGPVMYDANTMIGESSHQVVGSEVFPAAVGTPGQYPAGSTYSNILGYADYALIPSQFVTVPNGGVVPTGVDTIFTEIEQMDLVGYVPLNPSNAPCSDPRVPTPSSGTSGQGGGAQITVQAGPGAMGIGPSLPLNRRSIGIVQQITNGASSDFPAQSFFDIYVEVNLPQVPGTAANYDFPATGAVLYNDASDPLFIENPSLTNLPPTATYIHGNTTAVPIRFKYSNPPFWAAGDVLGYLTLAGHGVFTNVVTASAPCAAAEATGGLLDQVLGPVGSPIPPPPVPWLRPTNSFPIPGSGYDSVENTFVDPSTGVTNVNDDTVSFTNGTQIVYLRDLSLGSLGSSASLPAAGNSQSYNSASATVNFQISQNGADFYPAVLSGATTIEVYNTNGVAGSTTIYSMQMTQLTSSGTWVGGSVYLRESPTLPTLGRHTLAPDPRGYRVSSFFDVFLEFSPDNVNWYPANRSMRVLASMPPAVPGSIFASQIGNNAFVLQWQNNFTLQSTTNLLVPFTDVKGPVTSGSYSNVISGSAMFFRLRQ